MLTTGCLPVETVSKEEQKRNRWMNGGNMVFLLNINQLIIFLLNTSNNVLLVSLKISKNNSKYMCNYYTLYYLAFMLKSNHRGVLELRFPLFKTTNTMTDYSNV